MPSGHGTRCGGSTNGKRRSRRGIHIAPTEGAPMGILNTPTPGDRRQEEAAALTKRQAAKQALKAQAAAEARMEVSRAKAGVTKAQARMLDAQANLQVKRAKAQLTKGHASTKKASPKKKRSIGFRPEP